MISKGQYNHKKLFSNPLGSKVKKAVLKMMKRCQKQSNDDVRFLPHFNSYFVLFQYFEEGCEEGGELGAVDDPVPVHVQQVVEVFNVILGGGLASHQTDN